MRWVDQLREATGWQGPRHEAEWTVTEAELGTALPPDYKELLALFGSGSFSYYVYPLRDDNGGITSLLHHWRSLREECERKPAEMADYFRPHDLYGRDGNHGLILWGRSETGGRFYWLADDSVDPADWPLLVRPLPDEDWLRFEMSTSEFVYRAIADPDFKPVSIAGPAWPPTFQPQS